jgi:hypothetical protein
LFNIKKQNISDPKLFWLIFFDEIKRKIRHRRSQIELESRMNRVGQSQPEFSGHVSVEALRAEEVELGGVPGHLSGVDDRTKVESGQVLKEKEKHKKHDKSYITFYGRKLRLFIIS